MSLTVQAANLGGFFRQRRKFLNLTYADITERSGISEHTFRMYEQGAMPGTQDSIEKINKALDISIQFDVQFVEDGIFQDATSFVLGSFYQNNMDNPEIDDDQPAFIRIPIYALVDNDKLDKLDKLDKPETEDT